MHSVLFLGIQCWAESGIFSYSKTFLEMKSFVLGAILLMSFQSNVMQGVVTNVQDGDTIEVTINGKVVVVRLNGIDCPEDGQGFSAKAKQFTTLHCLKKKVKVEKQTIDATGRTIANVYLEDGTNLSYAIVENGYAWHYKKYSKDTKLADLETEARKKKIGLWVEENPVSPWDFKEKKKKGTN
jgi:endonuclease YncB( thermonuclease family)